MVEEFTGSTPFHKLSFPLFSSHLIKTQVPSEKILRAGKILRIAILSRAPHMIRDRKYHLKTYRYVCSSSQLGPLQSVFYKSGTISLYYKLRGSSLHLFKSPARQADVCRHEQSGKTLVLACQHLSVALLSSASTHTVLIRQG